MVLLNLRAWQLRLALCLPGKQIQWSGWVYFSMVILVPLHIACFGQKPE